MLLQKIETLIAETMKKKVQLIKEAKDGEELKNCEIELEAYRSIKSELAKLQHKNGELTEVDEAKAILQMVAQRKDSIVKFSEGNRPDLAEREEKEMAIINQFAPTLPTEDEIREFTDASVSAYIITKEPGYKLSMRDMKPVMEIVKTRYPMANGKIISSSFQKWIDK